jgi:hypothetical protein
MMSIPTATFIAVLVVIFFLSLISERLGEILVILRRHGKN